MVGIRRRFSCERQTTAHSLDPAFRLRNLYGIGSLEQCPGEVSIFDSVPFVSEVWNASETIDSNRVYQAEFLVYSIVERWHKPWFGNPSTARKSWNRRYCREP